MFCGKCGAVIAEGNEFCAQCGKKIDVTSVTLGGSSEAIETEPKKNRKKACVIIFIIVFLIVAFGVVFMGTKTNWSIDKATKIIKSGHLGCFVERHDVNIGECSYCGTFVNREDYDKIVGFCKAGSEMAISAMTESGGSSAKTEEALLKATKEIYEGLKESANNYSQALEICDKYQEMSNESRRIQLALDAMPNSPGATYSYYTFLNFLNEYVEYTIICSEVDELFGIEH